MDTEKFIVTLGDKKNSTVKDIGSKAYNLSVVKNEGFKVDSIEPMGALYLTIKLNYIGHTTVEGDTINNSTALVSYLIDKAGVALVPFSAFGTGPDAPWFRASVGAVSLEELQAMVPRLRNALTQLS